LTLRKVDKLLGDAFGSRFGGYYLIYFYIYWLLDSISYVFFYN